MLTALLLLGAPADHPYRLVDNAVKVDQTRVLVDKSVAHRHSLWVPLITPVTRATKTLASMTVSNAIVQRLSVQNRVAAQPHQSRQIYQRAGRNRVQRYGVTMCGVCGGRGLLPQETRKVQQLDVFRLRQTIQ